MIGYTSLYGLFVLTSIFLFNSLLLLSRYVRQIKDPPADEEFEVLAEEKESLRMREEEAQAEILSLKSSIQQLEQDVKKFDDALKKRNDEYDALKASTSANPEVPPPK